MKESSYIESLCGAYSASLLKRLYKAWGADWIVPSNIQAMETGNIFHRALLEGGDGYEEIKPSFDIKYPKRKDVEKRFFFRHENLLMTYRIDFRIGDHIYDLKTTNTYLTDRSMFKLCDRYAYDMQLAIYTFGETQPKASLIFYQKTKKQLKEYKLTEEDFNRGKEKLDRCIELI